MIRNPRLILMLLFIILLKRGFSQDVYSMIGKADSLSQIGLHLDAANIYEKIVSDEGNNSELSSARISELNNAAGICFYYAKKYDKALFYFEKVLLYNQEQENENNVALTLNNLGMVYNSWQQPNKAIEYYQKSIEILKQQDNKGEIATVMNNLGIIYSNHGNQDKAIEYFLQALEIDNLLNRAVNIASDLNNIGLAYKSNNQYEKASGYFLQGINKYQNLDSNQDLLNMMKNLSQTYLEGGKYDSALIWVEKSDEIIAKSGNIQTSPQNLVLKGDICLKSKQLDKAKDFYNQSLDLSLKENDLNNAIISWKCLGNVYYALAEYSKAIDFYLLALDNELKSQKYQDATKTYNKIGDLYMHKANYNEALNYYQNGYETAVKTNSSDCIALSLNNIGKVYSNWGKYDKAIELYKTALNDAINKNNQNDIAESYNNIGLIYKAWGKYEEAIEYFNLALGINTKSQQPDKIAIRHNYIGLCYQKKGDLNKALDHFNLAMNMAKQTGNNNLIANCYTNYGFYYKSIGDNIKALDNFTKAMEIDLKTGKEDNIASDYNNLGTLYIANNDYNNALLYFSKALETDIKLNKEADMAIDYNNLGAACIGQSQFDKAIENLVKAVTLKEKLRKTAFGDTRREYFESQINTYNDLIYAYISIQDKSNAFKTIELSKAKLLSERISKNDSTINIFSLTDIQNDLDNKTAVIVYATTNREDLTMMLITKNEVLVKKNNKKTFIDNVLKNFEVEIKSYIYDLLPENVKSNQLLLNAEVNKKKREIEPVIQFYRKLLFIPNPDPQTKEKTAVLGKILYDYLVLPYELSLENMNTLIIEPDGILGFLPFETLINKQNEYLVQNIDVSYTQSLSILSMIKKRTYTSNRKNLLAIGGAIYNKEYYDRDMKISDLLLANDSLNFHISKGIFPKYINDELIKYLQKKTTEAITNKTTLKNIYYDLGYTNWDNLPGSLAEVRVLSKIITDCDTLTAQEVTESKIKELSASGNLMKYRIIHFSTHGIGISEIPELSAIILNPVDNENEDGYLRMGEISELKLNADFVNLSACETGLGKIYSGEGVVGLTQAFIVAGANGISASLWQVNDKSTAQFMIDVFSLVKTEHLTYNQAINKTKRLYIEGKHFEKWKNPYFWAPFIYYGN